MCLLTWYKYLCSFPHFLLFPSITQSCNDFWLTCLQTLNSISWDTTKFYNMCLKFINFYLIRVIEWCHQFGKMVLLSTAFSQLFFKTNSKLWFLLSRYIILNVWVHFGEQILKIIFFGPTWPFYQKKTWKFHTKKKKLNQKTPSTQN